MSVAREVDLVLVTGAGASCAFGVNSTRLPLMDDWSEDVVSRLASSAMGYLEATGLRRGMDGPEFEYQLGRFLRSVQAFNAVDWLIEPVSRFTGAWPQSVAQGQWADWHRSTSRHLAQITQVIHESLYGLFASPAFDFGLAQRAYGELFNQLGIGPSSSLVYATTNYDTIGEEMIAAHGGMPDVGDYEARPFGAERPVRVDRLLDGMPRYTPVLHLHGRVGWFRRPDGRALSEAPAANFNSNTGVPIVMLPDLEKDYATDPIINTLWGQFTEALARAKKVLVLGHSLHDEALIQALATNVAESAPLGITFLPEQGNARVPANAEAAAVQERIRERLPGATPIPFRFDGATDGWTTELRDWAGSS